MTISGFEPLRRVSSLLKGLCRRLMSIFYYLPKKKTELESAPLFLPYVGYMSSCLIWLLQNFSPTTYRPPLPSRLLTCYSKPSKFTTGKTFYLLPESTSYRPTSANVANLVLTEFDMIWDICQLLTIFIHHWI